jgi:hypothetical protein
MLALLLIIGVSLPLIATVAAAAATIRVDPADVTHTISWTHGCHTDLGYSHQERGIHSQLLHGESFELMLEPLLKPEAMVAAPSTNTTQWTHRTTGATARSGLTTDAPLNGLLAATLSVAADGEQAAVVNRGFWQEGLALQAKKEYEGHVFARAQSGVKLELVVALEDQGSSGKPTVLAQTTLSLDGTGRWERLNFTLIPAAPTACSSAPWGAAPMYCEPGLAARVGIGAACLRCAGQLSLTLNAVGTVDLDMAYLQEGSGWGTLSDGIPAKRETVEWMARMGIRSIRTGGEASSSVSGLTRASKTMLLALSRYLCQD